MPTKKISGDALTKLSIVVDRDYCRGIADTVARERAVQALRQQGVAWRQARKQVTAITATPEMYRAVETAYCRGGDAATLRDVARVAARMQVVATRE
jgi:hypothetical protein